MTTWKPFLPGENPIDDVYREERGQPYGNYDFSKKSLAVLAIGPGGDGTMLWQVGGHLAANYESTQSCVLSENGLDGYSDCAGVYIWEGVLRSYRDRDGDYDTELEGTLREPTAGEWRAIKKGRCPWNDQDFKLKR